MEHKLFEVNQNAVIRNSEGGILILKNVGKWMLPGGRLEEGETWLEGLQREVKEETGIEKFIVVKILNANTSSSGKTYIVTFLCEVESVPEVKLSNEHQEYVWLDLRNIDRYEFTNGKVKEVLDYFLQKYSI
ncbi:MAG: NUDIX domain-containing protein [Candidatus Paceibacterota bacterium]